MANNTIPQANPARQEDSGTKAQSIQSYRNSDNVTYLLAVEIFDAGNDRAADILKLCGFDKLIGGANFASLNDVANFYGVNPKYVRDAMRRYGVSAKDLPDDVCSDRFSWFIQRFGADVQKRNCLKRSSTPGTFLVYDSFSKRELVVTGDYDRRTTYISSRLILMLSCFLFYGRRIPERSTVETVFNTLKRTSLFEAAARKELEAKRKLCNKVYMAGTDQPDVVQPDNILAIRANGDVVMNGDIFDRLLEKSSGGAREVLDALPVVVQKVLINTLGNMQLVAELKPKLDKHRPAEQDPAPKKRNNFRGTPKPENWDAMVPKLLSGEINKTRFAYEVGISPSSVWCFLERWNGITKDMVPKRRLSGPIETLRKPDNWDEVVKSVDNGTMTPAKAAKTLGMSDSSFRRYYKTGFDAIQIN